MANASDDEPSNLARAMWVFLGYMLVGPFFSGLAVSVALIVAPVIGMEAWLPDPLPPIGELAEVTVSLPDLPAMPVVSNATLRTVENQLGVWQIKDGRLRFVEVSLGASDLDGYVQIYEGLKTGDQVVVYSEKALNKRSHLHIVEDILEAQK